MGKLRKINWFFWGMFILCFLITGYVIPFMKIMQYIPVFRAIQEQNHMIANGIVKAIQMACSLVEVNLTKLFSLYVDYRKGQTPKPRITITFGPVTCIRKNLKRDGLPVVILGEGNYFVYIGITLKNVGKEELTNFAINECPIELDYLKPGESHKLYFRVCREANESFLRRYKARILFDNSDNIKMSLKMSFCVDEKRRNIKHKKINKVTRRRLE
ncbi:hypothetical protein [Enterocloster bolteae]|uniref:hypothetical protein n=1 Tax=Enterocloster bolteae TaxID=208479 RepID=UPI002A8167B1|nr:hypothetical protein [Enterocloster bolteae]